MTQLSARSLTRFLAVTAVAAGLTTLVAQTPTPPTPQGAAGQGANANPKGTPAPTPPPAPAPRQTPLEQLAFTNALGITDPAREASALRALLDNPQFRAHSISRQAQQSYFTLLVTKQPDKKDEITASLDAVLANMDLPASAPSTSLGPAPAAPATPEAASLQAALAALSEATKAVTNAANNTPAPGPSQPMSAVSRLSTITGLSSTLVGANMMLDRAEAMLIKPLAAVKYDEYAKDSKDSAEKAKVANPRATAPTDAQLKSNFDGIHGRATETLGRIHLAQGNLDKAESDFNAALVDMPYSYASEVGLGQIEEKRSHDTAALDHYLIASLSGRMKPAETESMTALYKKVHGNIAGLDADLDKTYREKFPNPVKPQPYKAVKDRSERVVLAEMFTGSGCPPCVAADLAMDGLLEHYAPTDVIFLAFHANIPQPDPMVVAGGDTRRKYYAVPGVPTIAIDGVSKVGGGSRESSPDTYDSYVKMIDKELAAPATAALSLRAQRNGTNIRVNVDVSKLPADVKDPRLHIVLAEREKRFTGENGVRFHSMVVRAVAGEKAEDGAGFALTGPAKFDHTFDLKIIPADLTKTLADEMVKRRKTEATAGATPGDYRAEGHAMTEIDPNELFVVAFIQDADKKILQATRFDLSLPDTSHNKKK